MIRQSWYHLNRKSKNGHRALSRVPRQHRVPPWSCTPPIAKETAVNEQQLIDARRIMRELVLAVTGKGESDQRTAHKMLDEIDDTRLIALANEALTNFRRVHKMFETWDKELGDTRKTINRLRTELDEDAARLAEVTRAIEERDDLAVKYKELQKRLDPERAQLEIMYAVEAATKEVRDEIAGLRRELAQRNSEIDNLRASKKKLREAIARLTDKD